MLSCMRTSELSCRRQNVYFAIKKEQLSGSFFPSHHTPHFFILRIFSFKKNLLVFSHPGSPFRLCLLWQQRWAMCSQRTVYELPLHLQCVGQSYISNRLRHKWFSFPLFLLCRLGWGWQQRVNTSERTCDVDVVHISQQVSKICKMLLECVYICLYWCCSSIYEWRGALIWSWWRVSPAAGRGITHHFPQGFSPLMTDPSSHHRHRGQNIITSITSITGVVISRRHWEDQRLNVEWSSHYTATVSSNTIFLDPNAK